jgi:VWFA-related protein
MVRALAAAMLLAAFAPCAASDAPHARLRKVNVVALDAKGQPLTGLRSADFQLFEDGKRQDIAFFRFTGDRISKPKPGPHEYSNDAAAARYPTVILIDLLTDRMLSDSIISKETADSLKNLESSDGLYLYLLTATGTLYPIHALPKPDTGIAPENEPWTRNAKPLLDAALKDLVGIKPIDDRDIKFRFDLTVKMLRDLGSQMAEAAGRKNLVWVTRGIPIVGYSISTQSGIDFSRPLEWLCEQLAQAQIVVHTVEQSGGGAAVGTPSSQFLEQFGDLTGGREYSSDRVGDAIRQAGTDSRANYEIAYYSAATNADAKYHKIRVTCAHKEARLQTEHGFYVSSPSHLAPGTLRSRELSIEAETAIHSPFEAGEIGLRASVSPDPAHARVKRFEMHIDSADVLARNVFVVFAAYDEEGKQPSAPVIDQLSPAQVAAAGHGDLFLHYAIPLGPAVRRVRAIVFDAELSALGSVTIPIEW